MINIWKNGNTRIAFDDTDNKYLFIIGGRVRVEIASETVKMFDPAGAPVINVNEAGGIQFLSEMFGMKKSDSADMIFRLGKGVPVFGSPPAIGRGRLEICNQVEIGKRGEKQYIPARAGVLVLHDERGDRHFLWVDTNGQLRISGTDPGSNGLAGRVVGDNLQLNVKKAPYFAKGDGHSDDREAIQTAINDLYASGSGSLYFPAGEYVINNPGLLIPRGGYNHRLAFHGEGRAATQLSGGPQLDIFTPLIRYDDTDQPAYQHLWENMTIGRGNPGPVFAHAQDTPGQRALGCVFRNMEFRSLSHILKPGGMGAEGSLDIELADHLDTGQVSVQLQAALQFYGQNLSLNAYVEVEIPGSRWRIVDWKPEYNSAVEYVIRRWVYGSETGLHVHVGTGHTFSIEPALTDHIVDVLDNGEDLTDLAFQFAAHGQPLAKDAYVIKLNLPASGNNWKVIDNKLDPLGEVAFDAVRKEYAVWKAGERLYIYRSKAATRLEGLLQSVLDTVAINGGVTALGMGGSHITTINLSTVDDHKQVNAVDIYGGNMTLISTRIEACEGGYGLRLSNCHNILINGAWFEGKRTHPRIEIMDGSYDITIMNPVLSSTTIEHCTGLLVHGGVANVRVIGGQAGNFNWLNDCYALKVESGARQVYMEHFDGSPGFSRDGSSGNYWVEPGAYDVAIRLNVNGAQGGKVIYRVGNIGTADIIYYMFNQDTGENEPVTDLRIDDYDIFNIAYKATHEIRRIVYGDQPSGYEGQIIRLIFKNANATVRNGVGNIRLSGNADFHPGAGATLSLLCDGFGWYEIGRTE